MRTTSILLAAGAAAATLPLVTDARAALCGSLSAGVPLIWIENGDTQEPLLKKLGYQLARSGTPLRIVYKNRRTCDLAADMYSAARMVNDAIPIRYVPTAAEDPAWTPGDPSPTCEADAGGHPIDLAIGATFISSCTTLPPRPANVQIFTGPIQAYGFIVPKASSQTAITAEEGYFAFGFPDGTGQAVPWTDATLRFTRGPTASTALTTAAAIGLEGNQLAGTVPPTNTSSEVLNLVATSVSPEKTIGLMGTEVYDSRGRNLVKLLAFKAFGQRYAYFPDSTPTSFDKKNVRDGHYTVWSPTEYLSVVDGGGAIVNASAKRIVDLVFGRRTDDTTNGIDEVIGSGLVPRCAMGVQRPFEGANLSLYQDPEPCGCYYESKVPQGSTACNPCQDDTPCKGGKCRRGFCEVR